MRLLLRLVSFACGVLTVVAIIQAFNGAPLWVAVAWGVLAIVFNVVSRMVPPPPTLRLFMLINAAGLEKRPVAADVAALIRKGANPNGVSQGTRPLNEAVMGGDVDVVETLLKHGANPNGQDSSGWTALHVAQNNDYFELAEVLVARGTDVNLAANDGQTPLHMAARRGRRAMTECLLRLGADPTLRAKDGKTPIAEAQYHRNFWATNAGLIQDRDVLSDYDQTIRTLRGQGVG